MAEKEKAHEVQEELNLDAQVSVKSIAGWKTGFARLNSIGDVNITPEGVARLTRNEIISQVQNNNTLFCGIGNGEHATYYIDDKATRVYLGFENEDDKSRQNVFSDKKVEEAFKKSENSFEKYCREEFRTRAEKYALIQAIKRLRINDYSKIRFVENYTGYMVQ